MLASMSASRDSACTVRPSDFATILLVTTMMSPLHTPVEPSGQVASASADPSIAVRSSPASNRWSTGTASTLKLGVIPAPNVWNDPGADLHGRLGLDGWRSHGNRLPLGAVPKH